MMSWMSSKLATEQDICPIVYVNGQKTLLYEAAVVYDMLTADGAAVEELITKEMMDECLW
jgi:hypothetical protein